MKASNAKLRQIIREELLNESWDPISTALKYYADISVHPRGREILTKDFKDVGIPIDDIFKAVDKYAGVLSFFPPPVGLAAAAAVVLSKLGQGDEEGAERALIVGVFAAVGFGALAKAGLNSARMSRGITSMLPPSFLALLPSGGARFVRKALENTYLKYAAAASSEGLENQVEEILAPTAKEAGEFKSAEKAIKAVAAYDKATKLPDWVLKPGESSGHLGGPKALEEAVIRRLLSEQPYKTPGQEYIALFLDGPSRDKLTDTLDDPPPGWALHADHMTVKFGSEGVPERYLGPAQCKVVGVALNDRVMAARVETDIPTQNDIPHITIATAPGAKPRESNDFLDSDFEEVQTFDLTGEVKPKFSDTLQKKMPKI